VSLKEAGEKYTKWVEAGREGQTQGQPNSAKTINRRVGSVQSFMKWAAINGKVAGYTLAKYAKQATRGEAVRTSRALTVKEVSKLLEWCKVNCPARHDVYRFALLTGLRANEIAELPVSAIDLKRGILTVHGKDTRNTNRVDTVPLHTDLLPMLKKAIDGKMADDKVFALPDHAAETLRRDCESAGVKADDVSFHGLRHTFITRLAESGVHPATAMKLARHKSLEMTLKHYTHLKTSDEQAALKLLK
jgi:integrase